MSLHITTPMVIRSSSLKANWRLRWFPVVKFLLWCLVWRTHNKTQCLCRWLPVHPWRCSSQNYSHHRCEVCVCQWWCLWWTFLGLRRARHCLQAIKPAVKCGDNNSRTFLSKFGENTRFRMLLYVLGLCFVSLSLGYEGCDGKPNTNPVYTAPPTFVKEVPNGKLYTTGAVEPKVSVRMSSGLSASLTI